MKVKVWRVHLCISSEGGRGLGTFDVSARSASEAESKAIRLAKEPKSSRVWADKIELIVEFEN